MATAFNSEDVRKMAYVVVAMIMNVSNDDRMILINMLKGRFCINCGSKDIPCYCKRDD